MKSLIKKLIFTILITVLLPINVLAKERITLKVNKTDVTIGDEIVVSASVDERLNSYAILATLKYDQNVFEKIDENDFTRGKKTSVTFNDSTNKFGIINKTGSLTKEDGNLFQISLKVKEDANVGNTNIALTNISSSDGGKQEHLPKVAIKVSVTRDAKDGEEIPTNKENVVTDDNEKVVRTFSNVPIIVILTIGAIALIAYMFIASKKGELTKKSKYILIISEIALLIVISMLVIANYGKKDVNKDGVKDYDDAEEIIKYLIDVKGEETKTDTQSNSSSQNKQKNKVTKPKYDYDVNNDGKVDIEDVGHITENIKKETKVKLTEENEEEEYYVTRGLVDLRFKAEITPEDVKITKVKIDGKYYDVVFDGNMYTIQVEITRAGFHEFVITEVHVDNDQDVKTSLKFEREVLKAVPSVNNYKVDDKTGSLSFDIVDEDDAFVDGKVVVYNGRTEISSQDITKKGTVTIKDIPVDEDTNYKLVVTASYDLDYKLDKDNIYYENETIVERNFTIGANYKFTLTEASITNTLEPGEIPIISFKSTNNQKATVESASITNDKKQAINYQISKVSDNNYEAQLLNADTTVGKHTISIDSVRLDTLKSFVNDVDYKASELTYTVLKEAPKVEELELKDNREDKKIEVSFKLKDVNKALNRLVISLMDSTNKVASQKEITNEEILALESNLVKVALPYDNSTDGLYKVVVYADYDLGENYHFTNVNIGEDEILSAKDIYIKDMYLLDNANKRVDSPYITKDTATVAVGVEIVIGDEIKNYKTYGGISYVTINGINWPVSTVLSPDKNNGAYLIKALMNNPKESGVLDLRANRVQLSNNGYYRIWSDYYAVAEKVLKIEILKDKPKIENLKVVTEDYENGKVTFGFDVVLDKNAKVKDNSFTKGILTLDGKEGEPSVITKDEYNEVTFEDVTKNKELDLIFKAEYDLDTNILDLDKNSYDNEILKTKYSLYDKETYQDVTIKNARVNKEYYDKSENIVVAFELDGKFKELGMKPQKVVINNHEYELMEIIDGYATLVDGFHSSGKKKLEITDIIFDYGKEAKVKEKETLNLEVLKDAIKLDHLEYTITDENIKLTFNKVDSDDSLVNAKIVITDEKGNSIYNNNYQNEVTIERNPDIIRYFVKVVGNYDLDTDKTPESANYVGDVTLLDEIVSLDKNNIELKDIIDVNLYKQSKDGAYNDINRIDEITYDELKNNLSSYFVEVVMESMPSIRVRLKDVSKKDNQLYLILDFTYVTKEGKVEANEVSISFGEINDDGVAKNEFHPEIAIKKLIDKLNNNENITLMQNYDFSKINIEDKVYIESYSGTLNGDGFTFKNLNKPLFGTLTGKVNNLNINNVIFDGKSRGALANDANNAEVTKVLIDKVTRTSTGDGQVGGLFGYANKTKVEACRVTGAVINAGYYEQQNGLLIGKTDNSTVNNSYAEGKIQGGYNYTGGFIGNCRSTKVTNSYVKVTLGGQSGSVSAFADAYQDSNSVYENNVSIASNTNASMIGSAKSKNNNYFYLENNTASEAEGITVIKKEEINDELFKTKLSFDEDLWYIKDISYDNLPIFQSEKKSVLKDTSNKDYKVENETLYYNLVKLMPYYDTNKIINIANTITDTNLVNKKINHILPFDNTGNLVTYVTNNDTLKITRIRVVFTDKTKVDYAVKYDKTYDMVASYRIMDLGIDYNYQNYVIDANSQLIGDLTSYLQRLDYSTNLDILTTGNDSRIYKDFYNEVTSKEIREFVLKYVANSGYANTTNDKVINDYLENEIKKNQALAKALYTYNYLRRFYDVKVGNMKLYDFMMFNMTGFNSELNAKKVTDLFFSDKTGANFNTGATSSRYGTVYGSYTKMDKITDFLEYVVTEFSDETNMAHWVKEQFKGILVELPIEGHPEIQYTLWDHFKNPDKSYPNGQYGHWAYEFILPILTLPEKAAYIISCPVEFIIGAQRTYMSDPFDEEQIAKFNEKLTSYTTRLQTYFTTAYGILENKDLFNNMHLFILDKRNTKNPDGTGVYNNPGSTTEPFHKNFDEVINTWPAAAGNNAAAWGYYIEMQVAGVLDSTLATDGTLDQGHVTFKTLTHESAHNLDDRLFFKNNGQRGGGEDYADAFLMQAFEKFGIVMNLSIKFDLEKLNEKNQAVGSNLTPERINTEAKISDFYQKAFETIYTIDYLEAQAFLQLPKEDQAKLAIQVSYPNAEKVVEFKDETGKVYEEYIDDANETQKLESKAYKDDPYAQNAAYTPTQYTKLDQVADFDFESLKTINDLVDKKIMLYPGKEGVSTLGPGRYGGEGYNVVHWYQPHNDYGFPDSYSFKWISYEMLGYAGYTNGFIEYASKTNTIKKKFYSSLSTTMTKNGKLNLTEINFKSDATALKTITKGKYEDFDLYKKNRFAEIANKLERLNPIINAKTYVQKFYDALKQDVNDKNLTKSSDVRFQIYNTLKNETNDFRDNNKIYMETKQQEVNDLNVQK